jgi:uncharacterized protein (TIGR02594 family)
MRFAGDVKEITGTKHDPAIIWFQRSCDVTINNDEVAWCSGFLNRMAWLHRLPRSKSLAARSWLIVGEPIALTEATAAWDIVILKRGKGPQPGPDVLQAQGHVGLFARLDGPLVYLLAGNQSNAVTIQPFPITDVLGVRRLFKETL